MKGARVLTLLLASLPGVTAAAQPVRPPPGDLSPPAAAIWPFPAPDPRSWWDDKRPPPAEAADPLGGRRLRPRERLPAPDNGLDPSAYRLWGLQPLQWQALRGDEAILELWIRPADSVRQTVVRITLRGDGRNFVQARAGLACCEAGIGRRVGFDAELASPAAQTVRAAARAPLWTSPRDVRVAERDAADAVCVDGTAYDLTLATRGRVMTLHRACDPAEVGEAADVLEAVLGAALGHEPRIDVLFPKGADFAAARSAYQALLATGGRLKANPDARPSIGPSPLTPPAAAAPSPPGCGGGRSSARSGTGSRTG